MPPRSGAEVRSGGAFVGEEVAYSLFVYDTIADELSTGDGDGIAGNGVGRILGEG